MINSARLLAVLAALLIASAAWAQQPKSWLGVDVRDVTKDEATQLGWEAPRGVKVMSPRANGPAARAGILAQDVIVSVDGREVENKDRFVAGIGDREPGAKVKVRLLRGGREHTLTVALERQPFSAALREKKSSDGPILQLELGGTHGQDPERGLYA